MLVYAAQAFIDQRAITREEFEEYRESHSKWGDAVIDGHEAKFTALRREIQVADASAKEWRVNQADFNRQFVTRLDAIYSLLLERLPAKGHTEAIGDGFPWETECVVMP